MIYESDVLMAFWNSRDDIRGLMNYLAKSMSTHLRDTSSGGSNQVVGNSYTTESYITVRWPWLTLPAAVVVLVTTFALVLMVETRRTRTRLWKNSMLALLFHGFDDATRQRALAEDRNGKSDNIAGMNRLAEGVRFQLGMGEKDGLFRLATKATNDR